MKFIYATLLVFVFSFTLANAQIGDFVGKARDARGMIEDRFDEKMEERKSDIEEKREERAMKLEEHKIKRAEKIEEMKEKRETRIEEIKERQEERRIKLDDKKKGLIEKLSERVFEKLDGLVARLQEFSTKTEGKISEFEDRGIDMSDSWDLLDEANDAIAVASASASEAQTAIDSLLDDEVSKEAIRDLVNVAREDIKSAHKALVEVIKSIKANVGGGVDDSDDDSADDSSSEEN